MTTEPTSAQAKALGKLEHNQPVIFINCHKYYDRAQYPADYDDADCSADVSGWDAYHRYLWSVERDFMPQVGGRFLMVGPVELVLIGDVDWDEVVIGEYPSKDEAFRMQTLDGYAALNVHRKAGLANVMTMSFSQHDFDRLAIPDVWIKKR